MKLKYFYNSTGKGCKKRKAEVQCWVSNVILMNKTQTMNCSLQGFRHKGNITIVVEEIKVKERVADLTLINCTWSYYCPYKKDVRLIHSKP